MTGKYVRRNDAGHVENRLIAQLMALGDLEKASVATGITIEDARALRHNQGFNLKLTDEANRVLFQEGMPLAIAELIDMIKNRHKRDRLGIMLCKIILDRVGFTAARPKDPEKRKGSMAEYSIEELQQFIVDEERKRAHAASLIAPNAPLLDGQDVDFMG